MLWTHFYKKKRCATIVLYAMPGVKFRFGSTKVIIPPPPRPCLPLKDWKNFSSPFLAKLQRVSGIFGAGQIHARNQYVRSRAGVSNS